MSPQASRDLKLDPDLKTARAFLEALDPKSNQFTFQTFDDDSWTETFWERNNCTCSQRFTRRIECLLADIKGDGAPFGLQSLIGKLLAIVSDARLGGRANEAQIAENILRITGEDLISIPRKFMMEFTARLHARIMILTNELPKFNDGSGALPSRFLILQLTETFYDREDHALGKRLISELPSILNWALDGLSRLMNSGRF